MKGLWLVCAIGLLTGSAMAKDKSTPELDAWAACMRTKIRVYAAMDVLPETAAKAAMGACKDEEIAYFDTLSKPTIVESFAEGRFAAKARKAKEAEEMRQGFRQDFEAKALSVILELRAAKSLPATPAPANTQ